MQNKHINYKKKQLKHTSTILKIRTHNLSIRDQKFKALPNEL